MLLLTKPMLLEITVDINESNMLIRMRRFVLFHGRSKLFVQQQRDLVYELALLSFQKRLVWDRLWREGRRVAPLGLFSTFMSFDAKGMLWKLTEVLSGFRIFY